MLKFKTVASLLLACILLALAVALLACGTDERGESSTSSEDSSEEDGDRRTSSGADSQRYPTPTRGGIFVVPTPTAIATVSESPPTLVPPLLSEEKPEGYHHGQEHGLALVQTSRKPSVERDGWVDITLNLVAIRFGGTEGSASTPTTPTPNSVCFGGEADCFLIKWGSTEQFVAEITPKRLTHETETVGAKAVNLAVTFEVAANADNANLYFGENKIPVNLQGDAPASGANYSPQPAPTPPPSGDAKTNGFFIDSEHGIAVSGVHRIFNLDDPPMLEAQVDLAVLPLGDYQASGPGVLPDAREGSVCFGTDGGECLRIFWGPEEQFDAILSLQGGEVFANARSQGARWPLPVSVRFNLPRNHHDAVLEFGEHRIPIDVRGMRGDPAYDYTAHYREASPGTALYDADGKTVVLDAITHNSDNGDLELRMTASNSSEAEDFAPAFITDAIFSQTGLVDATEGTRAFSAERLSAERLAPGQSATLSFVVPRDGDPGWGHVYYSIDPAKRPDGVVFQVVDELRELDASSVQDAPARVIVATATPSAPEAAPGFRPAPSSVKSGGYRQASLPAFVKFDRTNDEERFWPLKLLWSGPGVIALADGVAYTASQVSRSGGWQYPLSAVDIATGDTAWKVSLKDVRDINNVPVTIEDGVAYIFDYESRGTFALDAATGDMLWKRSTPINFANLTTRDGVWYTLVGETLYALDPSTGVSLWEFWAGGPATYSLKGGMAMVQVSREGLHALDAATGDLLWTFPGRGQSTSVSLKDGVMYAILLDTLHALDAATGDLLWTFSRHHFEDLSFEPGEEVVYLSGNGIWGNNDALYALDAATGDTLWEFSMHHLEGITPRGEVVHLLVAQRSAWGATYYAYVLDANTGNALWVSDYPTWSLTIDDGVAYLWGGQTAALDAATGDTLWVRDNISVPYNSVGIHERVMYALSPVPSGEGYLMYALDAATGNTIWVKDDISLHADTSFTFDDGVVYVRSAVPAEEDDYLMYVLDAATGDTLLGNDDIPVPSGTPFAFDDGVAYAISRDNLYAILLDN